MAPKGPKRAPNQAEMAPKWTQIAQKQALGGVTTGQKSIKKGALGLGVTFSIEKIDRRIFTKIDLSQPLQPACWPGWAGLGGGWQLDLAITLAHRGVFGHGLHHGTRRPHLWGGPRRDMCPGTRRDLSFGDF